jgi:hypothetical protein
MNSAAGRAGVQSAPDYYARGLAFWPRFVSPRQSRVRGDPRRIAALVSRRTNQSYRWILSLWGAPDDPADAPGRDN